MRRSLLRYGQISAVVVCDREGRAELLDGFKRLGAARSIEGMDRLRGRWLEVDERGAKAALYALNRVGARPREVEEAWIVHALIREDGLSQIEVAELVGRHKSWVCRRLAMIERLDEQAREDLRLGLLTATAARELIRLPCDNQLALLEARRRHALSSRELGRVVDLLLGCEGAEQQAFVLTDPRAALAQDGAISVSLRDPRLSRGAARIAPRLALLLERLPPMESWLRLRARGDLSPSDRRILDPQLEKLASRAMAAAEAGEDFLSEIAVP